MVPVLVLLLVALWFILRGDLLYVFLCVILFLGFSVLLVLRLPRLGKRELILVLFVRLFGLCLFRFVGFLFLLGSGKGCGLWLWHSLDFSLTFFLLYWPSYWGGPGASLTLCCFVVYCTGRFVVYLTMCHFVLVFFSPFSIAITSLGEDRAILVLFVRLFDLCLFGFVGFLFLLVSGKGCGLWLWHSLDLSLTFF